jgi:parallel beta-helix repeat protein
LVTASDTANVIDDNTVVGNTNGIFVVAGAQGNLFQRNLVTGNPGLQVSVDNPSSGGLDIKDLAGAGANVYVANVCQTSANAPCPSAGVSFTAAPNPITITGSAALGQTTISWSAPDAQIVEIRVGSPAGPLFARQVNRGSAQTGVWVTDGLAFYLQDVTGGRPLTSDYTLATLVLHVGGAPR